MLAQRVAIPELIATRVLPSGLFESTYGTRNATSSVLTDPRHRNCSCGQTECRHLDDALDMLDNHHCPRCGIYSPYSVLCAACAWGSGQPQTQTAPAVPLISHDIQPGDAQCILYAAPSAPVGICDVQLYVGPDSVEAEQVMDAVEYLAFVRKWAAHLLKYAADYETALNAECMA